jgi:hypothetical protein
VFGRRLLALLIVLAVVGLPAGVLRAVCAGNSCRNADASSARVPFCPLPKDLKANIVAGFREGRSPDVLAVTNGRTLVGGTDPTDAGVPWPTLRAARTTAVPIVFAGTGVDPAAAVPDGVGLDQIAPTIAEAIGLRRPHPGVRSGEPVTGISSGERPRLVLEVAWKGVGQAELDADIHAWPFLRKLARSGAGILDGTTGSLPLDPAATLTTIGTGGTPSQHGITGTLVRNNDGDFVRAWRKGSPLSIIATLPDDLDEAMDQRPVIGLVATDPADRGIIGGNWYPDHDRDAAEIEPTARTRTAAVTELLSRSFGRDDVPDVLAVVMDGSVAGMDAELRDVVRLATEASGGSLLVVVAGTGSAVGTDAGVPGSELVFQVEELVQGDSDIVEGAVPGGLFLDQRTLAEEGITGQSAVDALLEVTGPGGETLMADAFQGFAVSFARYC